jgi:HK97 gp10 family phage protein
MPIKTRLETKGFSEYLERLAKAGRNIDRVSDEALKAGGEILLLGMVTRAPHDTYNLIRSLDVDDPKRDGNFHFIEVGVIRPVNADVPRYANVQEFGSAHTPACPYIRPTLDGDMSKARAEMKRVFVAAEVGIEE